QTQDLMRADVQRVRDDAQVFRDDLEAARREAAELVRRAVPDGFLELANAVEHLRADLARQDAHVDARITTSHRASEALRAELTDMRAQMSEILAAVRNDATAEGTPRPESVPAAATILLQSLHDAVAALHELVGRVPGGHLLWTAAFPPPLL